MDQAKLHLAKLLDLITKGPIGNPYQHQEVKDALTFLNDGRAWSGGQWRYLLSVPSTPGPGVVVMYQGIVCTITKPLPTLKGYWEIRLPSGTLKGVPLSGLSRPPINVVGN